MTEPAHPQSEPAPGASNAPATDRTAELTEMLAYVSGCWDEERRLLARQLHDSLGSSMTALTMHLALLSQHIPAENKSMRDRSAQMKTLLANIIETNRKMQLELWNDKLEFLGLKAALAELVPEFGAEHGLTARASLPDEDGSYSRNQGVVLLRCAEEGLRNVAAHARATEVDVVLDDDGEQLMLTVRDNGAGLPEGARVMEANSSHGLRLLRERARFLGGTLELSAADGGGALLRMTLPKAAPAA
ncbi:sensor histidine kinase [Telluria aromaticivorans]|uniref:Oxygen sensor histidine kinase NreB n=1 Tax=Telluria aromaticivorans TaxID=2725995 RepID=A0A7Y2P0Y0_9BURK|nr:ATP-binding protein [Telluria aromaticivorans]NNG23294.1 histidine kinase [Telluria aromaticivorans]